jgi:ubiquinone/menaquinone biosynthesis C-methylase UbiE
MPRRLLAPLRTPAFWSFVSWLDRSLLRLCAPDVRSRYEFNRWAEKGMGEVMELDHTWLLRTIIPEMELSSGDCVLDVGCGDGWACRQIAAHLGGLGSIVGVDVSDEMVRRGRTKGTGFGRLAFVCGSAERLPFWDGAFSKLFSISAIYYFEHQEKVLAELLRVLAPNGRLFLLTCLYKDLPDWRSSAQALRLPVHVRGADDYKAMLQETGWTGVQVRELVRASDAGGNAAHARALLITARVPALEGVTQDFSK